MQEPTIKFCKKCGCDTERYTTDGKCRPCVRRRVAAWQKANPERVSAIHAAWRKANPDRVLARHKAWNAANRDTLAAYSRNNRAVCNAHSARRKAAKISATPKWANLEAIKAIYAAASLQTKVTGVRHDADHIVPLRSPIVCGLHCEANLEVITAKANREKGNRWWPNMPEPHPDMP